MVENINYWKISHPTEIKDEESKYLVSLMHAICDNLEEVIRNTDISEEHIEDWVKSPQQKKNMRKFLQCLEEFNIGEITDALKELVSSSVECSVAYNKFCNDNESTKNLGFTDYILNLANEARKSKWRLINELLYNSTPFNRHEGINEEGFVEIFKPLIVGKYLSCYSMLNNSENPLYKEKITGIETLSIDDGEYQIHLSLEGDTKTKSKCGWPFDPQDIVAMAHGYYVVTKDYEEDEDNNTYQSYEEVAELLLNKDPNPVKDVLKFIISY